MKNKTTLTDETNEINTISTRKITLDNKTLEKALLMSSKYYAVHYFNKTMKPDEILSLIIQLAIDYTYSNKFIKDINSDNAGQHE